MTAPAAASAAVLPRVLAFVEALRRNGLRVSPEEAGDAAVALAALSSDGFVAREGLKSALAVTLVKSAAEEEVFSRLFDLHFSFALEGAPLFRGSFADELAARGLDEERARALEEALLAQGGEVLQSLVRGDAERITEMLRSLLDATDLQGLESPLQIGYFAARLLARLGMDDVESRLQDALAQAGRADAETLALQGTVDDALSRLRRAAKKAVELEHEKRNLERMRRMRERSLSELPFARLDREELARMRDLVRRLALRLKTRVRARQRASRRGRIDARRTLRANVGYDSVPVRVHRRRPRKERPEIVVLCDVSDSVRGASLFMLELVWSLTELFRRVRGFVFVADLAEVTDLFRGASVESAIERVLQGAVVNVSANSDYGRALRQFWDGHMSAVTKKTTVVVLGDGRTNYRPAEAWVIEEIRRRARRVLWLVTEDRGTWGYGDSEMRAYARHADGIQVVRNLFDLARAVDRLVL